MKKIPDGAIAPAVITALSGGGALGWMLWHNGIPIFSEWFLYPSAASFFAVMYYLIWGSPTTTSTRIWKWIFAWSGIWTIVFAAAFALAPFSLAVTGNITGPMLKSAGIGPFNAGFLHLLIFACATDVLRIHRKSRNA